MKNKINLLTIDLEDWFHILDHHETKRPSDWPNFTSRIWESTVWLLDLFEELNVKATFFVLGSIAENHAELFRKSSLGATDGEPRNRSSVGIRKTSDQFEDIGKVKGINFEGG